MSVEERDPFAVGPFVVAMHTERIVDRRRQEALPVTVWYPESRELDPRPPLVLYSHHSGGHRAVATFLMRHLASHGYVVAALDHYETASAHGRARDGETVVEREARVERWIANRVPDLRLLLDHLLGGDTTPTDPDPQRVGVVGHSFGGWTALMAADVDDRIRAVVAHAPGGGVPRRPGIIPALVELHSARQIPTMFIAGDSDCSIPLASVQHLFDTSPWPSRLFVLSDADHLHFIDEVAAAHEAFRHAAADGDLSWIAEMRPIAELCSPEAAKQTVAAATLCHFDSALLDDVNAAVLLDRFDDATAKRVGVRIRVYSRT
jgi:predicted dienelactone hydrolase